MRMRVRGASLAGMSGRGLRKQPISADGQLAPMPARRSRKPVDGEGPLLVAGGGVAALEAVLAIREHAPELPIELICPERHFEYRPLIVLEPFVDNASQTVDLHRFAERFAVELRPHRLASVETRRRTARTDDGNEIPYRALLIAIGAQALPGLDGAQQSFSSHDDADALHGALEQFKPGSRRTLAFVIGDRRGWVLPFYELALLSREMLNQKGASDCDVAMITAERRPLEILGSQASAAVERLLESKGIALRANVSPLSVADGAIRLRRGDDVPADHVVAQPRMRGPSIEGLPHDRHGFLRVDPYCRLRRRKGVYAAGDITAGHAKQGGLAASQAEVAAGAILADLGYPVDPAWFEPQMDAVLLTGRLLEDLRESGGSADWTPPSKIASHRLSEYLGTREPEPRQWRSGPETPPEVELGDRWS